MQHITTTNAERWSPVRSAMGCRVFSRWFANGASLSYLAGGGGGGGWSCCQATPRAAGSVGVCTGGVEGVEGVEPGFLSADLSGLALSDGSFGPCARTQSAFEQSAGYDAIERIGGQSELLGAGALRSPSLSSTLSSTPQSSSCKSDKSCPTPARKFGDDEATVGGANWAITCAACVGGGGGGGGAAPDAWAPRGGSMGLGEENIGGGGMGPISVTPIGGSGSATAWAPCVGTAAAQGSAGAASAGVCTLMPMTGDRLGGCEEAVVVTALETVGVVAADVPDDEVTVTTGMAGSVAARAGGNFAATDGEPEPVKQARDVSLSDTTKEATRE